MEEMNISGTNIFMTKEGESNYKDQTAEYGQFFLHLTHPSEEIICLPKFENCLV